MNTLRDLRTSAEGSARVRDHHRAVTRVGYLHGLMGAGVCDAVRDRVKARLLHSGVVLLDPERDLRDQLGKMPTDQAVHLLTGVAARCDFVVDVPRYAPLNDFTIATTDALRNLGLTFFVWPDYGPEGPPMNPEYILGIEEEAAVRVANWQPDPATFLGVLSPGPMPSNQQPKCYGPVNQAGQAAPGLSDRREQSRRRAVDSAPQRHDPRVGFGESRQVG